MYYQMNSNSFLLFVLVINIDWASTAVNKIKQISGKVFKDVGMAFEKSLKEYSWFMQGTE